MENELNLSKGRQTSRYIFHGLAWLMVACIIVQTGIAGLAVFNADPAQWNNHTTFVHFFEMVPLLMLLFAFTGRLPKTLKWHSAGLFLMIFLQYLTANLPGAGLLHPIIALLLFYVSFHVAKQAWLLKKKSN